MTWPLTGLDWTIFESWVVQRSKVTLITVSRQKLGYNAHAHSTTNFDYSNIYFIENLNLNINVKDEYTDHP